MHKKEYLCGRPHFQSGALLDPGLSYTLYAPRLCEFGCDADERW
jgi:hypothetical protein